MTGKNQTTPNLAEPRIPDYLYRIFAVGGFESGETNVSSRLTSHQPDIDKIYLYAKYQYKPKYQQLVENMKMQG